MDPAPASFEKSSVLTKHSQPAQATLTSRTAEIGTQPGGPESMEERRGEAFAKRFRFYTGSPGSARKVMDVSHFLYRGYLEKMTEKESSYGPTQRV